MFESKASHLKRLSYNLIKNVQGQVLYWNTKPHAQDLELNFPQGFKISTVVLMPALNCGSTRHQLYKK